MGHKSKSSSKEIQEVEDMIISIKKGIDILSDRKEDPKSLHKFETF